MKDLIDRIVGTSMKLTHGDKVEVISNSGHAYQIGDKGTITNINFNGHCWQYVITTKRNPHNGNWIFEQDLMCLNEAPNKSDLIKELKIVLGMIEEIPEEDYSKMTPRQISKRYKSYKFLKLFNSAKTDYDKLNILEEIIS